MSANKSTLRAIVIGVIVTVAGAFVYDRFVKKEG